MTLLRRISLILLFCAVLSYALDLPIYLDYGDVGPQHRLLKRSADSDEGDDFNGEGWTIPSDVEVQEDDKPTDHVYYTMNVFENNTEQVNKYFVDIEALLNETGVVGNRSHAQLSKSHRRAVGVNLTFVFPFYGHKMRNVTIATGGFIYIGDQTHSWLAATQYIAPLMANFNTHLEDSDILYADDGKKFVVEWRKVQLREQEAEGPFTFQLSMFKNGDITFVYKEIPMEVQNISHAQHPVKMGISDAYLFQHLLSVGEKTSMSKRVIYEYHRIEVPMDKVAVNTVVLLTAQPTCIGFTTCDECSNSTLKHFNCTWCHSKKKNGGPFCTDQAGLHRRRQHWIENNCKEQGRSMYCSGNDENEVEGDDPLTTVLPDPVVTTTASAATADASASSPPTRGYNWFVIFLFFVVLSIAWVAYAYYNPHTPSGQLLIKYRPSRWQVPSSHVRYSASVHM